MNQMDFFTWVHQLGIPLAILVFVGAGIWKIAKYVGRRLFEGESSVVNQLVVLAESFVREHQRLLQEVTEHLRAVETDHKIQDERAEVIKITLWQIARMIRQLAKESNIDVEDAFTQIRLYLRESDQDREQFNDGDSSTGTD